MNTRFLQSVLLIIILSSGFQNLFSAEFLVRDEICIIDSEVSPWEGARKWVFDGAGPANWLSPNDYYNGTFHFRYEIISQPTNRRCGAQFVIWQDWNYPIWKEQASAHVNLYGPGDVDYGSGSPASWWKHDNISLDFSRPDDFYKLGIMVWSMDPFGQIAYYRTEDPEWNIYDEIWADRGDWFPMTLRFTVVAVSAGSTFSGNWASYMGGGDPGIQPAYSINFLSEETNENILTQHEYSHDNSNWLDGTGGKLALSPSSTVYFRDKNENSMTQTLNIPARPAAPSFAIDFASEQTTTPVSSAYEYFSDEGMSGASVGTGNYVSLSPGVDMYFRLLATATTFKSNLQTLSVPERPAAPLFSIDYVNECTAEPVGSDTEYASTVVMSDATAGAGVCLNLTPGQDIFLRKQSTVSAFTSEIYQLDVPERPGASVFTIDFVTETTAEVVSSEIMYADNPDFDGAAEGTDSSLPLTPGEIVYFRKAPTASSFESTISFINSPERPVFSSLASSPTQDNPILIDLTFSYTTSSLDTDKLIIHNAIPGDISGAYTIPLVPIVPGIVDIRVAANAVPEGNFASEQFDIEFEGVVDGLGYLRENQLILYPNPARDRVYFRFGGTPPESFRIMVFDALGNQVLEDVLSSGRNSLDLGNLTNGIYAIIVWEKGNPVLLQKLIITAD